MVVGNKCARVESPSPPADGASFDLDEQPAPPDDFDDSRVSGPHLRPERLRLIRDEFAPRPEGILALWLKAGQRTQWRQSLVSPNAVYLARGRVLRRLRTELTGLVE